MAIRKTRALAVSATAAFHGKKYLPLPITDLCAQARRSVRRTMSGSCLGTMHTAARYDVLCKDALVCGRVESLAFSSQDQSVRQVCVENRAPADSHDVSRWTHDILFCRRVCMQRFFKGSYRTILAERAARKCSVSVCGTPSRLSWLCLDNTCNTAVRPFACVTNTKKLIELN